MAQSCLHEQVLVAALPDRPPEVHVATLEAERRAIVLREARVLPNGEVAFGKETTIQLAQAATVDASDGMLGILARDGALLVQLHVESPADRQTWTKALRAAIASAPQAGAPSRAQAPPGGAGSGEEEVHQLLARSRQLQGRIGTLEATSDRCDKQLRKMLRRLDGAMQMLQAVQEMCAQQRQVILAQQTAIQSLTAECGEDAGHAPASPAGGRRPAPPPPEAPPPRQGGGAGASPTSAARAGAQASRMSPTAAGAAANGSSAADELAEAENEIAMKTEQMMALLQQADEMQRALQALEELGLAGPGGGSGGGGGGGGRGAPLSLGLGSAEARRREPLSPKAPPPTPAVREAAVEDEDDASEEEADEEGDEEGDSEEAIERLRSLEAEKERFEGMLQASQSEQEELLQRLEDMRSLMSMLGLAADAAGGAGGSPTSPSSAAA